MESLAWLIKFSLSLSILWNTRKIFVSGDHIQSGEGAVWKKFENSKTWKNFITWNIRWMLINILFLLSFWGKYEFIVSLKIRFFLVTDVFLHFSYCGNRALGDIWVLNHFSRTRLSSNFRRFGGFLSEDERVLFETVQEIFSPHRMLNGVKFAQKGISLVL